MAEFVSNPTLSITSESITVPTSNWTTNTITTNTTACDSTWINARSISTTDTFDATINSAYINKELFHVHFEPEKVEIKTKPDPNPHKWNTVPADFDINTFFDKPVIANIDILVPNKVVEVTIYIGNDWFNGGKREHVFKQVCKDGDEFNLKYALALAWAKFNNKARCCDWSIEGIELAAQEYLHKYNKPNKEFDRAIKAYNNWLKEEEKKKAEEEERKAIIARRKEKNRKRREKRKAKHNEEQIDIIAKAIQKSKEG